MRVENASRLPEAFVARYPGGAQTRLLGEAAGSQKIYVHIDVIPPGQTSAKFHAHTRQEEFFLVLSGSGTLRLGEGTRPVAPGDFIAKPPGPQNAHTFFNSGKEALVLLDVGTLPQGDVCLYPDEDVCYLKDLRLSFSLKDKLPAWSSEPLAPGG